MVKKVTIFSKEDKTLSKRDIILFSSSLPSSFPIKLIFFSKYSNALLCSMFSFLIISLSILFTPKGISLSIKSFPLSNIIIFVLLLPISITPIFSLKYLF